MRKRILRKWFAVALSACLTFALLSTSRAVDPDVVRIEDAFARIAEETFPSVVVIHGRRHARMRLPDNTLQDSQFQLPPELERHLRDRFDMRPRRMPQDNQPFAEGRGSGFFIDKDGHILTNNHVVAGSDELLVRLQDGREFKGRLIGTDRKSDLAVVKIDSEGVEFPFIEFADSDKVRVGQWAIAIGAPFNFDYTMTVGIVSQKGRSVGLNVYENYIQTDASINPGNSGGPLLDIHGKLIGVNNFIVSGNPFSPANVGLGFAIPSNMARDVFEQLIKHGEVVRPWIGISMQPLDSKLKEQFGAERGVLVVEVFRDNPAESAGLQPGDVIVDVDGLKVDQPRDVQFAVLKRQPGDKILLNILRDGKESRMEIVAGKQKRDELGLETEALAQSGRGVIESFGFSLKETDDGLKISEVKQGGTAMRHGLQPDTSVYSINRKNVRTVKDAENAAASDENRMLVHIGDGRSKRFIVLER